jgi:hypothetical protein
VGEHRAIHNGLLSRRYEVRLNRDNLHFRSARNSAAPEEVTPGAGDGDATRHAENLSPNLPAAKFREQGQRVLDW